MNNDDRHPPKASGSLAKSELYVTLAVQAAEQLEGAASRLAIEGGQSPRVEEYRHVAAEARELASEFQTWVSNDPGPDLRIRATARLMDVRAAADAATRSRRASR